MGRARCLLAWDYDPELRTSEQDLVSQIWIIYVDYPIDNKIGKQNIKNSDYEKTELD